MALGSTIFRRAEREISCSAAHAFGLMQLYDSLATLKARPTCSLSYKRLLRAQVLSDTAARELMGRWAHEVDGARWIKAHEGRRGERAHRRAARRNAGVHGKITVRDALLVGLATLDICLRAASGALHRLARPRREAAALPRRPPRPPDAQ